MMHTTVTPHAHTDADSLMAVKPLLDRADHFQIVADLFKKLGDGNRVRIFWLLCHTEECVLDIAALLSMSSPAVSHHLRALKVSGLITSRREGKEMYYRAGDTPQSHLLHQMIEQVMEIACPEPAPAPQEDAGHCCRDHISENPETSNAHLSSYQVEQLSTIREIHDQLSLHLDKRWNIEDLARQHLMNPTTLKMLFKEVYGSSIAAHIKEHRMEEAARLLRETADSISDIACRVGYTSQSRFTESFKEFYGTLPREYRRQHQHP